MEYGDFNSEEMISYFSEQKFRDTLTLYIQPTDEDFSPDGNGVEIDFRNGKCEAGIAARELKRCYENAEFSKENRHVFMKVRKNRLAAVIRSRLSWEELSIGFQCRFLRKPDIYNAGFWFYFSNCVR